MWAAPSAAEFRRFVRAYLRVLSAEEAQRVLSFKSADWAAQVRRMHAQLLAEGPGLFCCLDAERARLRRPARHARDAASLERRQNQGVMYVRSWSHPSANGIPLVSNHPMSLIEEKRRDAEALIVGSLRFCDGDEPFDTFVMAKSILREHGKMWKALMVLSAGKFAGVPCNPADVGGAAARSAWFSSCGWYSLGSFIASRLDLQLCASLVGAHMKPSATPRCTLRRVPGVWYCGLAPKERLRLILRAHADLGAVLEQRRKLLRMMSGRAEQGEGAHAKARRELHCDAAVLRELIFALQGHSCSSSSMADRLDVHVQCGVLGVPHVVRLGAGDALAEEKGAAALAQAEAFLELVFETPLTRVNGAPSADA